MIILGHEPSFWIATGGAIIVKLLTSGSENTMVGHCIAIFVAVFAAYQFTDVSLVLFKLDQEVYKAPIAALLALTGEGLIRWLQVAARSPLATLTEALKSWRGK